MKKLIIVALLATSVHAAQAAPAQVAAQPKSARLLAPEYRDLSLLNSFSAIQNGIDFANPIPSLKALNAQMLAAAKADKVQPNKKLVAPRKGSQPAVDLYVFQPKAETQGRVIYFIHGGGYIIGNARMENANLFALAEQNQATVISAEYRLATDAPFPADIDDAYHGLSYLFDNAAKLGIDPKKIIIMGESAGGGLAARLALKTRDIGKYRPAGQVLIYPMLDHRTGTAQSPYKNPNAGEFLWTAKLNRLGWDILRGGKTIAAADLPYYSAARAEKLAGLPQTFMMVGSLDLFANEDTDYANRLISAGVPTDFLLINGVYHAFESTNPGSPQTKQYIAARNDAIKRMFDAAE
ncbi:alpha/beta hydrolase [Neisseria chenwenguii]|uniref:Alpha/beta hydrolase n=1 Tax=Neisseria chenwenguii TaxID=1853278 RepID=A0A220RZK1_9NEIS|nr:alpha/beta hydrolase [Neisseria chenwenguii]ASK26568.1 alpha/beta hydrolase [Neisseria chenwenguii]ROV56014.1 alpha/beta hydrolase [Neisseria chenwenguii]